VKSNQGAAGVDEVDIDEIREYGEARFLAEIEQELHDGSYRVSLVRRVHIQKPGQPGKTRPLGIPTVKDRVVQMAVKLVIEPLFEADFVPCSFGFRRKHQRSWRSARKRWNYQFLYKRCRLYQMVGRVSHLPGLRRTPPDEDGRRAGWGKSPRPVR
jgi:RNA-directed DNA polymerase